MKRLVFEIILMSIILKCTATSLQYIDVEASWEKKFVWVDMGNGKPFIKIYVNEPFTMRIHTDEPMTGVRCAIIEDYPTAFQFHDIQNFSVGVDLIQDSPLIYVLKKNWTITESQPFSTFSNETLLWKCEVLFPPDGTKTRAISFDLDAVIDERVIIKNEIYINGERMNTSQKYDTSYHEEVNYFFLEGELAEIMCLIRNEFYTNEDASNITTVLYEKRNNLPAFPCSYQRPPCRYTDHTDRIDNGCTTRVAHPSTNYLCSFCSGACYLNKTDFIAEHLHPSSS